MTRLSCPRRSGSTSASICVTFPLVTVNAITESTRPAGATTAPAAPLTSAGPDERVELGVSSGVGRYGRRAAKNQRRFLAQHAAVDPKFDIGIEHRHQGIEVAIARGGEERADDLALSPDVRVWPGRAVHASPRSAGELL